MDDQSPYAPPYVPVKGTMLSYPAQQTHAMKDAPTSPSDIGVDQNPQFTSSQFVDDGNQDVITQFRIRVAVLENELTRTRQERDSGLKSLPIIIEALTRNSSFNSPGSQLVADATQGLQTSSADAERAKSLEDEVFRLRRENRVLRDNVKELRVSEKTAAQEADLDIQTQPTPPTTPRKMVRFTPELIQTSSAQHANDSPISSAWAESPILTATSNFSASNRSLADVGLGSLEENMGLGISLNIPEDNHSDEVHHADFPASVPPQSASPPVQDKKVSEDHHAGFPASLIPQPASSSTTTTLSNVEKTTLEGGFEELEKTIDEQLADDISQSLLAAAPTPNVLKIGFAIEGHKRGAEYDVNSPQIPQLPPVRPFRRNGGSLWTGGSPWTDNSNFPSPNFSSPRFPEDKSIDTNLWDSVEDRDAAIKAHNQLCNVGRRGAERAFPDFFTYGIKYQPAEGDINKLRTVHLGNLPAGTELREVLARVRGGEIWSATLLDTMKLTGGLSVRIVFMNEVDATEFLFYTCKHQLTFGSEKQVASRLAIDTPTYPIHPNRLSGIKAKGQTRCVAIPQFPEDMIDLGSLIDAVVGKSQTRADAIVEIWQDEEGTLHLEFANVDIAGSAWAILSYQRFFRECPPQFERDPCAGPLEELKLPVQEKRPMLYPGGIKPAITPDSDSDTEDNHQNERKTLASLPQIAIEIPRMSGEALKSASWADEVISEADDEESDNSPHHSSGSETVTPTTSFGSKVSALDDDVNRKMKSAWGERPSGLAGSIYADAEDCDHSPPADTKGKGVDRTPNGSLTAQSPAWNEWELSAYANEILYDSSTGHPDGKGGDSSHRATVDDSPSGRHIKSPPEIGWSFSKTDNEKKALHIESMLAPQSDVLYDKPSKSSVKTSDMDPVLAQFIEDNKKIHRDNLKVFDALLDKTFASPHALNSSLSTKDNVSTSPPCLRSMDSKPAESIQTRIKTSLGLPSPQNAAEPLKFSLVPMSGRSHPIFGPYRDSVSNGTTKSKDRKIPRATVPPLNSERGWSNMADCGDSDSSDEADSGEILLASIYRAHYHFTGPNIYKQKDGEKGIHETLPFRPKVQDTTARGDAGLSESLDGCVTEKMSSKKRKLSVGAEEGVSKKGFEVAEKMEGEVKNPDEITLYYDDEE